MDQIGLFKDASRKCPAGVPAYKGWAFVDGETKADLDWPDPRGLLFLVHAEIYMTLKGFVLEPRDAIEVVDMFDKVIGETIGNRPHGGVCLDSMAVLESSSRLCVWDFSKVGQGESNEICIKRLRNRLLEPRLQQIEADIMELLD